MKENKLEPGEPVSAPPPKPGFTESWLQPLGRAIVFMTVCYALYALGVTKSFLPWGGKPASVERKTAQQKSLPPWSRDKASIQTQAVAARAKRLTEEDIVSVRQPVTEDPLPAISTIPGTNRVDVAAYLAKCQAQKLWWHRTPQDKARVVQPLILCIAEEERMGAIVRMVIDETWDNIWMSYAK